MVRYALVLLFVLAGCASTTGGPGSSNGSPSASSPASSAVAITIEKTGGFAGVRDTIQIDALGSWSRSDKSGKAASGQLTAAQVTELQALAADPKLASEAVAAAQAAPTNCNDTFNYTVSAGPVVLRFTDCPTDSFQPTATKALISYVEKATVS
jgi:hypothetical protein